MEFVFCDQVHAQPAVRASFNDLTRRVFGFDFEAWDRAGLWTERYRPHALLCGDRVVANVSVNRMRFRAFGRPLELAQLGTVMTDPAFRGQGLARRLMEEVLCRLPEDVYLFANDTVLDFYPRFGFRRGEEHQYSRAVQPARLTTARPLDPAQPTTRALLEQLLTEARPCEALCLEDNAQLYLFYLLGPMKNCLYELPEHAGLAIAEQAGEELTLHALLSDRPAEWAAGCFAGVRTLRLAYTPAQTAGYTPAPYHEEDTTLFYRGSALKSLLARPVLFPSLSHA